MKNSLPKIQEEHIYNNHPSSVIWYNLKKNAILGCFPPKISKSQPLHLLQIITSISENNFEDYVNFKRLMTQDYSV